MLFILFIKNTRAQCTQPRLRVEWREMPFQQTNYLSAVKCLQNTPSVLDPSFGSSSRYDDFVYLHWEVVNVAHGSKNADFLPWHRLYLHWFEIALRHYCGYQDPLPYWDWTYDGHNADHSDIWNAFGGSGWSDGCVHDGAFANQVARYPKPGCLKRNFQLAKNSPGFDAAAVTAALRSKDYASFSEAIQFGAHAYVHLGIGGSMNDLSAAAADPIFFLHHANVDRLWALWQSNHPEASLQGHHFVDREGNHEKNAEFYDVLYGGAVLAGLPFAQDYRIGDMWRTDSDPLCYVYSNHMNDGIGRLNRRSFDNQLKQLHISPAPCTFMTEEMASKFQLNCTQLDKVHAREQKICDFRGFIKKQLSTPMAGVGQTLTVSQFYDLFIKQSKRLNRPE